MGVPKKRRSYSKKKMRRAHQALEVTSLSRCKRCGEPNLPHRACPSCLHYDGKSIALDAK